MGAVLCLLGAGYLMYSDLRASTDRLTAQVGEVADRMSAVERAVQLYRFEQQTKEGLGFPALLEQLRHWGPQMGSSTTPASQFPVIQDRLDHVLAAMASLGSEVFPKLMNAFEEAQPGRDDELQMWLLRAMLEVNETRALDFMTTVLEGMAFRVAPRLRLFAAEKITEIDPKRAAVLLRTVLSTETHNGLDVHRVDPRTLAKYPEAAGNIVPYRGFSTFVQKFVATEDEDAEQVLLMVVGRKLQHDFLTLQECVKELGEMRSTNAVGAIEDLFENPPRNSSPMFRNHCLDALAVIQGSAACEYFQAALLREQLEFVRTKLTELIKAYCD